MADVFISYSQRAVEPTRQLAEALTARGIDVWWDTRLSSGQRFDDVIRQELEAAEAVIVIWTPASVQSAYVKMEAGIAFAWEKLITVRTEDLPVAGIPAPFRGLHAELATDIDRLIIALGEMGVQPKRARRKRMTMAEIIAALGALDASLPAAVEAFLRRCKQERFRIVTLRSIMIKAAIPGFGDVNFGTLFPDGTVQTNYISDSAERIGAPAIAADYLEGIAALIDGAIVRRDGAPWTWRVEVFGQLPAISELLKRGEEWLTLMKTARRRFAEAAAGRGPEA